LKVKELRYGGEMKDVPNADDAFRADKPREVVPLLRKPHGVFGVVFAQHDGIESDALFLKSVLVIEKVFFV
jgi:hypothetical protein